METKDLNLEEIMKEMGIKTGELREDAVFCTPDLPMESLQFIHLLVKLENAYQLEINVPEISAEGPITYGRLKAYISDHV